MTELGRLLESGDDFERALLESVRTDLPAPSGLRDTALALGLASSTANALASGLLVASSLSSALGVPGASVVGPAGASSGAVAGGTVGTSGALGIASAGVLGKSLLGGALLSFVALTALDQTRTDSPSKALAMASASATGSVSQPIHRPEEVSGPAAVVVPSSPLADAEPAAALASPSVVGNHRSSTIASGPAPAAEARGTPAPANAAFATEPGSPASPSVAAAKASLAAEIRILDEARAALAAGDTNQATQLLDAYAANRPSPTLAQEAALLRVRLLLRRGQRAAAAELARRIIAQHPGSAHVESLRRLAAEQ